MGKTKIKIIDDSAAEEKSTKLAKKLETKTKTFGKRDELVEKLKAELGVDEASADTSKVGLLVPSEVEGDSFEVGKVQKPTAEHLRGSTTKWGRVSSGDPGEESDLPQAKHLGGEVKGTQPKGKKPAKAKPRSKKYQQAIKNLDRSKTYPIDEAIDMVKKLSYSKFNGTLEAHINTAQTGIRGLVSLPFASGKKLCILAFPSSSLGTSGKGVPSSGDILVGDDSTIEEISKGKIDFDLVITTPEWMPKLAKVAKILGPKGLMPNPKNGTITDDLKKAVEGFQGGKTEYKTESKAPVIHLALGKLDQPSEELSSNVKTLLSTLGKSKIKKVILSPTMGPSVRIDLGSI